MSVASRPLKFSPFITAVTLMGHGLPAGKKMSHSEGSATFHENGTLPKVMQTEEIPILIRAADCERDRIFLEVGIYMMLRVSEISRLNVEDFDFAAGRALIRLAKGGKQRWVPVHRRLIIAILDWVSPRNRGPLFQSQKGGALGPRQLQRILNHVWVQSGIAHRVTPHHLRHTGLTQLLEAGVNLRVIQEIAGHARLSTTEIYTHVADKSKTDAINRLNWVNAERQLNLL